MCADIMADVSGCCLSAISGILRGYQRRSVKGAEYPAIVPQADSSVEGVVYRDVPVSAWERLDRFEGEMYVRQLVPIELPDGATVLAGTYVARPESLDIIDQSDWNFANFLRTGKVRFQQHYAGYQAL